MGEGGGSADAPWLRRAGLAGAALGAVAAGVAVERMTVHRAVRQRARLALDAEGPYGTLRGRPATVRAEDGTELYYETEEPGAEDPAGLASSRSTATDRAGASDTSTRPDDTAGAARDGGGTGGDTARPSGQEPEALSRRRLLRLLRRNTPADAPLPTVVFTHGYCLSQDSWHFQRTALRGAVRAVYWDQRSHGRSGRGPVGEEVDFELLGRDLRAVLDAAVPEGPIVLVGHSMGGMALMAFAEQYPAFVAERVTGAAFLDTSAGGLSQGTYGLPLPQAGTGVLLRALPGVLRALAARAELVERGRRASADLLTGLVKRYSFGSPHEVDPGVARFAERLIESVPIDVLAEFYPAFAQHERTAALAAFAGKPALVLAGDRDLLTPDEHSAAIAAALPGAELAILKRTGHLAMLERPEEVNGLLAELLTRTIRTHGSTARPSPRRS